jgi:hypothetical protein
MILSSFKIYTDVGKLEPATRNNLDRFGFGYRKAQYFCFLHSQGGRLYNNSTTGQVLCVELWLPNGFMPSVLIANHMLFASSPNHGKWLLMLPILLHMRGA